MKAIILAAGQGTRLRPFTSDRPKCLVEIDGLSLLERQLAVLQSRHVDDIVLIGGYRAQMLQGLANRLYCNVRFAETNMVSSLFCAQEELEGDVIISYGDIVYSASILDQLMICESDIAVAIDLDWAHYWSARSSDPLSDAETLRIEDGRYIVEIGRRPTSFDEIDGQYMGLMKFTDQGLSQLKSTYSHGVELGVLGSRPVERAHMTDMLQELIRSGYRVEAVATRGDWIEVDTLADLQSQLTRDRLEMIQAALQL